MTHARYIVLVLTVTVGSQTTHATNIILNGGLEQGLEGWQDVSVPPGYVTVRAESAYSGNFGMYIYGPTHGNGEGIVRQILPHLPTDSVTRFAFWGRAWTTYAPVATLLFNNGTSVRFDLYGSGLLGYWWEFSRSGFPQGVFLDQIRITAYSDSSWLPSRADIDEFVIEVVYPAGDLNCDMAVNNFDIDAFVLALTSPEAYTAAYPHCAPQLADVNADGRVDNLDIDAFASLLAG